jgi:hypothetical protein
VIPNRSSSKYLICLAWLTAHNQFYSARTNTPNSLFDTSPTRLAQFKTNISKPYGCWVWWRKIRMSWYWHCQGWIKTWPVMVRSTGPNSDMVGENLDCWREPPKSVQKCQICQNVEIQEFHRICQIWPTWVRNVKSCQLANNDSNPKFQLFLGPKSPLRDIKKRTKKWYSFWHPNRPLVIWPQKSYRSFRSESLCDMGIVKPKFMRNLGGDSSANPTEI